MVKNIKVGDETISIEMGCNHPDLKNNSTESIGCSGNCQNCGYSMATMSIPAVLKLVRAAEGKLA